MTWLAKSKINYSLTRSPDPLAWILATTMFLKHTAQTINAVTNLIKAIAPRKNNKEKRGDRKED
jgi:hypothetical protein